jgi:hypothetical protein
MGFLLNQVAIWVGIAIDVLVRRDARCIDFRILQLFFWKPPLDGMNFVILIWIVLPWTWRFNAVRIGFSLILLSESQLA